MREIRPYGSVRGVRRKPYPYRDIILIHPVRSTAPIAAQMIAWPEIDKRVRKSFTNRISPQLSLQLM
jgi:hypothetical protein